jgi:hypothetical protein
MDTDRNLLFSVLALQADLLDQDQFVRACTLWSVQKATPLADLLVQQGWLTPEDRDESSAQDAGQRADRQAELLDGRAKRVLLSRAPSRFARPASTRNTVNDRKPSESLESLS